MLSPPVKEQSMEASSQSIFKIVWITAHLPDKHRIEWHINAAHLASPKKQMAVGLLSDVMVAGTLRFCAFCICWTTVQMPTELSANKLQITIYRTVHLEYNSWRAICTQPVAEFALYVSLNLLEHAENAFVMVLSDVQSQTSLKWWRRLGSCRCSWHPGMAPPTRSVHVRWQGAGCI